MELQKFEEAVRDYERVHKMDRSNFDYRQLLNQAKHELKKSLRKDYYKILGVDRNANEEEIKKALFKKRSLQNLSKNLPSDLKLSPNEWQIKLNSQIFKFTFDSGIRKFNNCR